MIVMALCVTAGAQTATPRKNTVVIRGRLQDIYLYPGVGSGEHRKLLFVPGDAGCRGFGAEIAEDLAKAAYNTYCLDTLRLSPKHDWSHCAKHAGHCLRLS